MPAFAADAVAREASAGAPRRRLLAAGDEDGVSVGGAPGLPGPGAKPPSSAISRGRSPSRFSSAAVSGSRSDSLGDPTRVARARAVRARRGACWASPRRAERRSRTASAGRACPCGSVAHPDLPIDLGIPRRTPAAKQGDPLPGRSTDRRGDRRRHAQRGRRSARTSPARPDRRPLESRAAHPGSARAQRARPRPPWRLAARALRQGRPHRSSERTRRATSAPRPEESWSRELSRRRHRRAGPFPSARVSSRMAQDVLKPSAIRQTPSKPSQAMSGIVAIQIRSDGGRGPAQRLAAPAEPTWPADGGRSRGGR
jgi:hypothetical protein